MPDNIKHPILQIHHDNMTISPTGSFSGMFYSEELNNAIKLGYTIKILRGYYFSKYENLFQDYIGTLYNLRLEFDKTHPMNYTAKLLMNSLYGRFGMSYQLSKTRVIDLRQ